MQQINEINEIDLTNAILKCEDCNKWSNLHKIFKSIYETEFVNNIIKGNGFDNDTMYTNHDHIKINENFKFSTTKALFKNSTNEEILSFYKKLTNGNEKIELFKKSFNRLINLVKNNESFKKYSQYDLFYLLTKLRCFSYLGREDFDIHFNETDNLVTIKMNFKQPSIDEYKYTNETDYVCLRKKIVKIIYNKTTGLYLKTELAGNDKLYNYVYNFKTGENIIESSSKIFNKNNTYWWLGKTTTHYIENGYYVKREDIRHVQHYYRDEETDKEYFNYKTVDTYMYDLPAIECIQ